MPILTQLLLEEPLLRPITASRLAISIGRKLAFLDNDELTYGTCVGFTIGINTRSSVVPPRAEIELENGSIVSITALRVLEVVTNSPQG